MKSANTKKEERLIILKNNQAAMEAVLADVTAEVFLAKPNPEIWSIAEIVEHVIKVEAGVIGKVQHLGTKGLEQEIPSMISAEDLLKKADNRSIKVKAPTVFEPSGVFKTKEAALKAFNKNRETTLKFAETTTINLKTISFPHMLLGMLNGEDWIVFVAGHTRRHIAQIQLLKEG